MRSHRLPVSVTLAAGALLAACGVESPDGDTDDTSTAIAAVTADETCTWTAVPAVTPTQIPATRPGVPVTLDLAISNPNPVTCAPSAYLISVDTRLLSVPRPRAPFAAANQPSILEVAAGATGHFTVTVTAPASADAGDVIPVQLVIEDPSTLPPPPQGPGPGPAPAPPVPPTTVDLAFPVAAAPGCQVSTARELMITDVSVVDDPVRTAFDPASRDPRNGAWSFKRLVENMARTPADAPAMVEALLRTFTTPQTINGFTVIARPGLQAQVLDAWPRTADGKLDLAKAPVRLQAIVNRLDLRDVAQGNAGEGRFVYAFILEPIPGAPPPEATIIFEYKLPAASERDVTRWADAFHLLGALPFGEMYNLVLQSITEQFTRRGARPGTPNGSAINAVRTNEIPFGDNALWELREFHLSARTGRLEPAALELTPDGSFDNTPTLASFINANQAAVIAEKHVVPELLDGQPFKAGAVFNRLSTWFAPDIDDEARHHFAINTCNGCHAGQETGTVFLHLTPRATGAPSDRSRWLTGTVIDDPVTGAPRTFDDLGRRKADMKALVCRDRGGPPRDTLRKGISRVH